MAYFVGLDVSVKETSVCIVDDAGKIVREARKTGKGWIEMPPRGSLLPYRGVLSFLSKAREASGSETPRVHHASRRRGSSVAARGARAAAGDAGDRVSACRFAGA